MKTKKNLVKRALSLVLALLIVLGLVPMSVFSAFAEELPELSATIDTGDSITLKDADADGYYDISNADELYAFAAIVNGGNASINGELTADIVVNENVFNEDGTPKINGDFREWMPIGDSSYRYSGIFDGQNHIVSGLYILGFSIDYVGLFGYVDNATVKNTGVIDSFIMGNNYVGGVCGQAFASKVINCYNSGVVNGMNRIGGVVGDIDDSTITNCYNTGTVSGANHVGGVSGNAYASKVIDCYNTGEVKGSLNVVGGVVGETSGGGTITNCYNTGEVKGNLELVGGVVGRNYDSTITNCYNAGTVSAKVSVGGLVGYNTISGKVANCYNIGTVSGEDYVGGVVGYNYEGTITNCYNTSTVIGSECVGGVVGENDGGTVTNCYNTGTVSSEDYAGGVVGYNVGGGTITNCYNTGTVSGEWFVGGVVGYSNSDGTITNCYNTGTVSGEGYVGGVAGWNYATTITNCYNAGTVSGNGYVGGVVGENEGGTVTNCYYSDTAYPGGIYGKDITGSAEAKTLDQFKSGEVAYLLQGEQTEEIWGQKISTDEIPVLGGDKVYFGYTDCKATEKIYTNTEAYDEKPSHSWDNGVCTICNNACEHQWEDGVCTVCEKVCEHEGSTNGFCADCGGFEPANYNEKTGNYEISNAGQLYWFADKVNNDNANFGSANAVLTADIVVNEGVLGEDGTLNESDDYRAWTPIGSNGNRYTGTFDGNGKTVSGLYFNNSGVKCVGLFGCVGENGTVKNIGVISSYFNGVYYVGGVVGYSYDSTITDCYNTGTVIGNEYVGGVVGHSYDVTITDCYNTGTVSGEWVVGGVVGYNDKTVTNCYNTGTVIGNEHVGGVAGENYVGTITDCYNTGTVSGKNRVGGVVGYNYDSIVTNCYNTGTVSGKWYVGGVVGETDGGTVTNCYYSDTAYAGGINGEDITGSAEAKTLDEFKSGEVAYLLGEAFGQTLGEDDTPVLGGDKVYFGYTDCSDAEKVYSNTELLVEKPAHVFANGFCTVCDAFEPAKYNNNCSTDDESDDFYEISNAGQLYWFADKVNNDNANFGSANAVLTADIVVNEGVMDENSTGVRAWTPIGSDSNQYTGTFDGNGKTVSGLYFNKGGASCVGLFGGVGTNGTVKNIGVINSYFNGYYYVGGVVGYSYDSTIANCYNTGTVIGNEGVGGVAGYDYNSTITNCYNTGTVSGEWLVGGVVGENLAGTTNDCYNTGTVIGNWYVGGVAGYSNESTIANCYNTGTVSGEGYVGGVAGYNFGSKTITNCYNTGTVIGEDYVGGVVGYAEGATIKNCYNTGTVSGEESVGGVAGYNYDTTITNCYYSDATCEGGINGGDAEGSAEAKTTEQFESGEVAYLLGEAFGQKIGEDDTPVLGGDKVYFGYDTCDEDVDQVYSNEALSYERLPHVWYDGVCTICDKACVHTGGTATCTKPAVCEICGIEYGDLDVNNHVGESTPEFNWFAPSYGSCYVDINLICDDCESSVAYDYGYASVAESAEGTDCLNPGYELYEITFEIDGVSYTDSYKHILKSDNHVGKFENGFCSVCGGFEPAYFNEEEWVYEIGNAGQLYWYAQKLNEENAEMSVVLTEDIVIPEDAPNWEPITASYVTFDGQFHTISGINSVHENYTYVGMFGNEVWWYEIKNLHLTDSNFEGSDYVGGLVASMNNGGTVQNCYVTNTTVKGGTGTGTLVGFLGMSNVINCYVDTDTLVGDFNGYGSIENSYYLATEETEDGGKTLEQFKSGEVAYLLQAGIPGEDIYDDDWNYIETIIPEIWGQTIGKEDYPVLGGEKVYLSDEGYYNKANKLAGYTISLGDKIAVNYYMSLTEKTINDANAKMVFTVPDTGSIYTVEIPVSEAVKSGDYYVFTCEVAAKEMTSVIKAKFVTSDTELQLEDYSVQQYAEVILSDTVKYANEQELVKAMLNYGAYAQICFGYNTESLANSILDEADKALATYNFDEFAPVVSGEETGVTYYGSTLSLKSETAIKHYFIIEDESSMPEFKVNGKTVEAVKNGTLYEVKITDLPAHNLDEVFTVEAGALSVQYGAFSYAYQALQTDKDALKDVVNALYTYNLKADEYVVSDSID